MSFNLADLFAPTPALPGAAGGIVSAPGPGEGAAFAEALQLFRAETLEGAEVAAPVAAPQSRTQPLPALTTSMLAAMPPERVAELGLAPDVLQRIEAGVPTDGDMEALVAALAEFEPRALIPVEGLPETAGSEEFAADDAAPAGLTLPPAAALSAAVPAEGGDESADMALRIANERPAYVPPVDKDGTAPKEIKAETPVLREGRSAATAPPPVLINKDTAAKTDIPQVSRAVLAALAPRATAATLPETSKPAAPVSAATTAPAATASQTSISPQAQALAAIPHVTSVRASVAAEAPPAVAPATPPQATITPPALASAAPSETPAVMAAAAPAAGAAPVSQTVAPQTAPAVELTGGAATEEKAADAALSALVKDKPETKPETPQAKSAANVADPEIASPKKSVTDADVKAGDEAKPEPQAKVKSAPVEKPSAPEPRAPQQHTQQLPPVTDRVIVHDAAARAVQQTAQYLPAAAIPQIAGEMAMRLRQGQSRFEIRLDPPELGRIDVRIEVDSDGHVHSRLMVEKTETLDLLKADQRALERALHEAGFKSEQNSLSFSLRDQRGGHASSEQQRLLNEMNVRTDPEDDPARLAADLAYRAPLRGPGGIDLRV